MKVFALVAALEEFHTKLLEHQELWEERPSRRIPGSASGRQNTLEEQSRWLSKRCGALRPYLEQFDDTWIMQHPATKVIWDALEIATGLSGHPGKGVSLSTTLQKIQQTLGALENLDREAEIPADRSKPIMSDSDEEWISAASALALLGRNFEIGKRAICKRAHAGLLKARAQRFIRDGKPTDDVDIPVELWWAEGGAALHQNWTTGDFDTWIDQRIHLQTFGVTFRRSDIERLKPTQERQRMIATGKKIFIGHGHSLVWHQLKDFLQDRLHLTIDEFNRVPIAGVATPNRLEEMLDDAAFAFLILTAEDEHADEKLHARENVVHEAGLFQGRLGFRKAILLLEETCEKFSNIEGLGHIPFPPSKISAAFEEIRRVLEREDVITSEPKSGGGPSPGGKLPERKGRFTYTHPRTGRDS